MGTALKKKTYANSNLQGRERILTAAEKLFIKRGFDGASVNEVAAEAGVAKALVFYHFNNKGELFDAILDRYYTEQSKILISAITVRGTIRERMHAGIDAYLDYISENPGYPRLIQGEICTNTRGLEKMVEHMQPLSNWGEALTGDILPERGPLSPRHLFISLFGMIVSYYTYAPVIRRLWEEDGADIDAAEEERRTHIHLMVDAVMEKVENRDKGA